MTTQRSLSAAIQAQRERSAPNWSLQSQASGLEILIANPRLEFDVSHREKSPVRISNRKKIAILRFINWHRHSRVPRSTKGLCAFAKPRIRQIEAIASLTREFPQSPGQKFLIANARLESSLSHREQSPLRISNRERIAILHFTFSGLWWLPSPSPRRQVSSPRQASEPFRLYARVKNHMDMPAIATEGLTRRFGALTAVDDVNLRVAPGQFFGFLGPNGAGKSTTIKMLTGLLAATAGRIEILGLDLAANAIDVKRQIGVVPEGMALFGRLTGAEYLNFVGRMYGLDRETAAKRAAELLGFMQLADQPKKLVTDYSHGMQKKLALAAAVIHGPKILFLDEPFEGVDAIASGTLKAMLQSMISRGATIFLTSHVLEIVERLCSHLAIIHRGRLVAQGSLEELRAGVEAQAAAALPNGEGHAAVVAAPGKKLTLEQIFLRIVGGARPVDQELSWLS